jgi:hypothetical protein
MGTKLAVRPREPVVLHVRLIVQFAKVLVLFAFFFVQIFQLSSVQSGSDRIEDFAVDGKAVCVADAKISRFEDALAVLNPAVRRLSCPGLSLENVFHSYITPGVREI